MARTVRPPIGRFIAPIAVAAAMAPLIFEVVRTLTGRGAHVGLWGDNALLDLATRDAIRGHQLLGPYSRFGWHHPGPAYFYWMALPVLLMEPAGAGLFLGASLLNALASAGLVGLVWRRTNAAVAAWTAAATAAFFLALGPDFLRQPWNPFVVVVPVALFVVLCADAATGRLQSAAWALVVGSFAVQTHVSTGPAIVALMAVALVSWLVGWWRRRRGVPAAWPWAVAGLAVFVLMWIPPLIDEVRHHPSNIDLMWRYFTASHLHHSLGEATKASLGAATILPFGLGAQSSVQNLRSHDQLVAGAIGLLLVGLAVIVIGWRRRQPTAAAIGAASLFALAVGVAATTRVTDPQIANYLVVWQAFVPLTLLIGLAWALFGGRPAPVGAVAGLVVVLVLAAVFLGRDHRLQPTSRLGNPDVVAAASAVERQLDGHDRVVRITMVSHDTWPTAAGIADELERSGHRTTVADNERVWTVLFGTSRAMTGHEQADVELYLTTDPGGAGRAHGDRVAQVGNIIVLTRQLG